MDLDWRSQLQPGTRIMIVNNIVDRLKIYEPVHHLSEDLNELKKLAANFEENVYNAATCQADYLRRIYHKIWAMEIIARGSKFNPVINPNFQNPQNPNPDWRFQLRPEARHRIVNKIMDTVKSHTPVPVSALNELQNVVIQFEEKIYRTATSQHDYLRKISVKMISIEKKREAPTELDMSELFDAPRDSEDSN